MFLFNFIKLIFLKQLNKMKILKIFIIFLSFLSTKNLYSQEGFPLNGVEDSRDNHYAFINAKIIVDYKTSIDNGTLIIKNGQIVSVGQNILIPKGIRAFDLKGSYIYPSFIDIYSDYGIVKERKTNSSSNWMSSYTNPKILSAKDGPFGWNESVNSEFNSVENIKIDNKKSNLMRKEGFGSVVSHNMDGILRGSGVYISLADDKEQSIVLKEKSSNHFSFRKGSTSQNYPNSLMGSVALLKQSIYDSRWYKQNNKINNEVNLSLDAINKNIDLPNIIEVRDKLRILLAQKVGKELNINFIIKGIGDEYQRLNEIKTGFTNLIVPVNFPKAFNVDDPFKNNNLSLGQLKHWEMAPSNLYFLEKNGINFSITTHGLKNISEFRNNLIKSIERGASKENILKALTYNPSKMINMENKIGSIKESFIANFIITDGDIFKKNTKILSNWVQGKWYRVTNTNTNDYKGEYNLSIRDKILSLKITGDKNKPSASIKLNADDTVEYKVKLIVDDENLNLNFNIKSLGEYKLSGYHSNGILKGKGTLNNLEWIDWSAEKVEEIKDDVSKTKKSESKNKIGNIIFPFVEYGTSSLKLAEKRLIKNVTIWTLEDEGIIKNGDVLIDNGKIAAIGTNLDYEDAIVVDGSDMHLTPGIIDEHSHIALTGVNEGSQVVTSEVRMKDVVNSEDVNIYRQLAGGVTSAQLLHGSANPVGGQSAIIKLRWGSSPQDMLIKDADEYIKFALGENVKRSRAPQSTRFPDTRMGVEQVFVDAFNRAKEYDETWKKYQSLSKKEKLVTSAPRKDLELDALAEILNGERFVTCHSYVQSEINMLMKVAEKFNFKVNTFTHILEGYKVADKMANHGVGGSTFSDWWAYKNEVKEAIPYNAALMVQAGVVTAINSDSREMARRLNQEAAKSIKYGNLSEIDALKMVTLNPAKLLHLDHRMGSIKVGKDADLVLWTNHPLSIYSRPSKTIVDGKVYYDLDEDKLLRNEIKAERARIISKMKGDSIDNKSRRMPMRRIDIEFNCDDIIDYETLTKIQK